jgi:hypothetical protein
VLTLFQNVTRLLCDYLLISYGLFLVGVSMVSSRLASRGHVIKSLCAFTLQANKLQLFLFGCDLSPPSHQCLLGVSFLRSVAEVRKRHLSNAAEKAEFLNKLACYLALKSPDSRVTKVAT